MSPFKEHNNTCKGSNDQLRWSRGDLKRMMVLSEADDDGITQQPAVTCVIEHLGLCRMSLALKLFVTALKGFSLASK